MSPRRADPDVALRLLEVTARLLADEGLPAVSARRVAADAGASTMAWVRPPIATTLVLALSISAWRSPGAGASPRASLTRRLRTHRARYHSA